MNDKKYTISMIIIFVVMGLVFGCIIFAIFMCAKPATEVEIYTEGFEINHMSIDRGRAYISARNDNDAFTIRVDGKQYAEFSEGDIIEVEIRVMERYEKQYKEYIILGVDN